MEVAKLQKRGRASGTQGSWRLQGQYCYPKGPTYPNVGSLGFLF